MQEEMDWTYVNTLLSVIHQASAAGPKFQAIAAKAASDLDLYMNPPAPVEESAEPAEEEADAS